MTDVPARFARQIVEVHGAAGTGWLADLPVLLTDCEQRWSLRLLPPYDLSYNYVAPAVRGDGSYVVLKVGVPNPELLTEMAALRVYNGRGIVQLLDADAERGVLLLEHIAPGTTLASVDDDAQATTIAANVMRQLWQPVPAEHQFPSVAMWARGLERMRAHWGGTTGPFPRALVEEAETLFAELLGSMTERVVLHGDLHHYNILAAQRAPWLALDPKGVVGEPAYEVGALLRNPTPHYLRVPDPHRKLARRVDQLAAELDLDRARIRGWGVAQAVLSAWWMVEDLGYGWEEPIRCAELLAAIKV